MHLCVHGPPYHSMPKDKWLDYTLTATQRVLFDFQCVLYSIQLQSFTVHCYCTVLCILPPLMGSPSCWRLIQQANTVCTHLWTQKLCQWQPCYWWGHPCQIGLEQGALQFGGRACGWLPHLVKTPLFQNSGRRWGGHGPCPRRRSQFPPYSSNNTTIKCYQL